jgi:hypothetical protein
MKNKTSNTTTDCISIYTFHGFSGVNINKLCSGRYMQHPLHTIVDPSAFSINRYTGSYLINIILTPVRMEQPVI